MARILSKEELRRRALAAQQAGLIADNPYPYTAGPYVGGTEITPIIERGILDYEVTEDESQVDPGDRAHMSPYYKTITMGDEDRLNKAQGPGSYNTTLIHELRHGGLNYLRENPHLMPYVMHYLQYDEGEFGRSLRDVLQRGSYDDVSMQTPEHKMLDAVDPRPTHRTGEIWEEGLLGPEISVSGFQSDEERAQYVQMMKEANEALEKKDPDYGTWEWALKKKKKK